MTLSLLSWPVLLLPLVLHAAPFPKADPRAGRQAYEEAKCSACHNSRMGGDGEAYMSSKAAKQVWRIEAFKAGTVSPSDKGEVGDPSALAKKKMNDKKYDR